MKRPRGPGGRFLTKVRCTVRTISENPLDALSVAYLTLPLMGTQILIVL
jgi:hypothetical protein